MFEQDYIMRQIGQLAKMAARLFFGIEAPSITEELEDRLSENENGMLQTLLEASDAGEICKAEDMLFQMIEENRKGCLETAILFYAHLDKKTDDFLEFNNFSRDEIFEGLSEVIRIFDVDKRLLPDTLLKF